MVKLLDSKCPKTPKFHFFSQKKLKGSVKIEELFLSEACNEKSATKTRRKFENQSKSKPQTKTNLVHVS